VVEGAAEPEAVTDVGVLAGLVAAQEAEGVPRKEAIQDVARR
jgi:16S rRNA (cytidine1402-2'-O)-methyltransferase